MSIVPLLPPLEDKMYPVKVLERDKKRCQKQYEKNQGNYRDTGFDRYHNAMLVWEEHIAEIDAYMALTANRASREFDFDELLGEIRQMVADARRDYPHDDGLLMLQNNLERRLADWKIGTVTRR